MPNVLVTGANGFIGRAVCQSLLAADRPPLALVRQCGAIPQAQSWVFPAPDFDGLEDAVAQAPGFDTVIHLAARVHVMRDAARDPAAALADYRRTNVEGSLRVARAALRAGAGRMVFVSSVKALGDHEPGRPWREDDTPAPDDAYGVSKCEAEQALTRFGRAHGLEVVIVRPPLVYGPGVRANFFNLMKALARGVPLPLGAATAQRSVVYVENLADALVACATHPDAAGRIVHVTDGVDWPLIDLIRGLADALHAPARLPRVPLAWLRAAGRLTGRSAAVARLTEPLRLELGAAPGALQWTAPYSTRDGLAATARWYRASAGRR